MKKLNLKITGILAIILSSFFCSYEKNEFKTNLLIDIEGNYLFQNQKAYCQNEPEKELWSKSFSYDQNNNLMEGIISGNIIKAVIPRE